MAAPQVPLANGTDDATFHRLFKPIMEKVVQVFQPGAVVLQCGAPLPFPQVYRARFVCTDSRVAAEVCICCKCTCLSGHLC